MMGQSLDRDGRRRGSGVCGGGRLELAENRLSRGWGERAPNVGARERGPSLHGDHCVCFYFHLSFLGYKTCAYHEKLGKRRESLAWPALPVPRRNHYYHLIFFKKCKYIR